GSKALREFMNSLNEKLYSGAMTRGEYEKYLQAFDIDPTQVETYRVQYLENEEDRKQYELSGGSRLKVGDPPRVLDTSDYISAFSAGGYGIFAMGPNGRIYVGGHKTCCSASKS